MNGVWIGRLFLVLAAVGLLFGFTPISRQLLKTVNGSFAPTPYSSLALSTPSDAATGILAGIAVQIQLNNYTGHTNTYHWTAQENGALISHGEKTLVNGQSINFSVPTQGAVRGPLRIVLQHTNVFITVPILSSRS
jgi:hypothetical protein